MKMNLAGSGLLALMVGTLAGCGGGSDDPAPAVVTTTTTVATTTTTTLAAAPTGATITGVTVNSPPVVTFVVRDSSGKHIPGLALINTTSSAAGLAADPNCSQNNVTFAMAKFDGANWQSLISRQRYATADLTTPRYSTADATTKIYPPTYRYAVVEGTVDPKPTATTTITKADGTTSSGKFANTAGADRIVGELVENATAGTYTYHFATDVSTSLLMKDAVDVKNLSVGKVANNGNLAVKDSKTIHRVGAQLCYTDALTKAKVVVNPYFDFTIGADGIAVPVKAADGTPAAYRKVVDKASCNECHSTLTAHGTRIEPNYCVICHNPGSIDYNTNNPVDFKVMIHKFHMGKGTLTGAKLSKDYRVTNNLLGNARTKLSTGEITGFVYPQAPQNCVKCHDGSATATNKTAQGDNWKSVPSRAACGACHDGIDFASGTGLTLADAAKGLTTSQFGHIGGARQDDTICAGCHGAADNALYHANTIPTTAAASKRTMSAAISKVDIGATDGSVTVNFTVTDNGVAVTDKTKFTAPSFGLVKLVPAAKGESSHWVSYTSRFRTKSATMPPVLQASNENNGTLTANADGSFSYKFKLITGSTEGDIRTVTHAHNVSTIAPYATTNWTGEGATVAGTGLNAVAYEPTLTHRVAMTFAKAGTPAVDNTTNAYLDFVPAGGAVTSTRNIVTMNNCATCHGGIKLHSGYDTEYCVTCHNQGTLDPYTAETVDLQRLIHKVHMGADLPSVIAGGSYVVNGAHDYSKAGYPGVIKDCAVCHKETATKPGTTSVLENAANWRTMPTKRACATCHDSAKAIEHINGQITASGEQCLFCHGTTSTYGLDVRSVHAK